MIRIEVLINPFLNFDIRGEPPLKQLGFRGRSAVWPLVVPPLRASLASTVGPVGLPLVLAGLAEFSGTVEVLRHFN